MKTPDQKDIGGEEAATVGVRRDRLILLVLFLILFAILFRPLIHGADGARYYSYLRSVAIDGDLDLHNEFARYAADIGPAMRRDPVTGLVTNAVPVGSAVMWAPWFAAAAAIDHVLGISSEGEAGYGRLYVIAVCVGSSVHAFLGLLMVHAVAWRWVGRFAALVAVVAVWVASPLIFYMFAHPSMSHANSFFAVSLTLWLCVRMGGRRQAEVWAAIGFAMGLAILVRFNNALWAIVPFVTWLGLFRRPGARNGEEIALLQERGGRVSVIGLGLVALGASICAFCPQLVAWKILHGGYFTGPRDFHLDSSLSLWSSPHFVDLFISGSRGLLIWAPVFAIGAAGWLARSSIPRRLTVGAIVIVLAQAWLLGGWVDWRTGASFGPRFFINCLPLVALGVAVVVDRFRGRGRTAVAFALAGLFVWNVGLMAQYGLGLIDREGPVSRRRLVANQFVAAPAEALRRAGDIVSRRDPVEEGVTPGEVGGGGTQ